MIDPITMGILTSTLAGVLGSTASMIASFLKVRKAQLELKNEITEQQRREVIEAKETAVAVTEEEVKEITEQLIISPGLLNKAVQGIKAAEKRLEEAISDIRYTPAQLDQEIEVAKAEICSNLQFIKDHNGDKLPYIVDRYWLSYKCGAIST